MNELMLPLIGFLCCVMVILYSGTHLARYGDQIAELTGWGKAWVGLILMSAITSLPELMTGISSVTVIDAPDLAAGDVLGSCVFNLLILSIMDVRLKKPLTSLVKSSHLFAGLYGIILIAWVGFALLLSDATPAWGWISPFSVGIIGVYGIAVYGIFHFDKKNTLTHEVELNADKRSLKMLFIKYGLHALMVTGAALFLPYFGETLAEHSGLGNTFFGTVFLAASTSLPELVVSFAALRLGSYDLAFGNLLGSNIFNIFILALDDLFYTRGSMFSSIQKDHLVSILVVIVMTAVVGLGLMVKPTRKWFRLSLDTLVLLLLYILLMILLYLN